MHREVFAGRPPGLLNVGEMPGATVEEARLYTDPARGELDMVFQFEHVDLDSGPGGKWDVVPAAAAAARSGHAEVAGRPRGRRLEQPLLEQPRPAARGQPVRQRRPAVTGSRSAKALGTVLHLHRGTPYVYQGEELGMTNAPFAGVEDFRDIESINHFRAATEPRSRPRGGAGRRCATRAATTRVRRCSGTPRRTPASPPASRGSRSTRTTPRSTRPRRSTTPTRSSTTTGG